MSCYPLALTHQREFNVAAQSGPTTGSLSIVVSAEDVKSFLASGREDVRIVDASPLREYRSAHLPNATHAFWEDTVDANYPVFGAVVTQGFEQRQRLEIVGRIGVHPGNRIVVYDRQGGFRAARIVWFLRFLGFPNVALLDGGPAAWQAIDGDLLSGVVGVPNVEPIVDPQDGYYVVTEALRQRLFLGNTQVVDARTDEDRQDTLGGQLPLGQIPGSIRLPWNSLIDPAKGALLNDSTIRSLIESAGITDDSDIVIVARFGTDTALTWLVLKSLGFTNVLTYDRGWVEWASTPELPVDPLTD